MLVSAPTSISGVGCISVMVLSWDMCVLPCVRACVVRMTMLTLVPVGMGGRSMFDLLDAVSAW